ncbi:MAG: c-type cytochrome [Myxococcales bacterium]|nr:c-type cytochrome [Myxococcales bacterium]MCB9530243.1 c-type cytochrome [Myxococcales bacterium]MCB9533756.1 c-type cytochrome [Myxococcales bacterium]
MAESNVNQLRGHADESDGIQEYDNKLPTWWVGLSIGTVVWGVANFADWHILTPQTLASRYDAEIAAAPAPFDVNTIVVEMTPEAIDAGAAIFAANCVACHQADATGGIGPSLVDNVWIHGSSPEDIRTTVATGVLDKGMPTWLPVLGPDGVAKVSAYVANLTPND